MASNDYKEVVRGGNPRDSVFNQPKPKVFLTDELGQKIIAAAAPYPVPETVKYQYGTAGVCPFLPYLRLPANIQLSSFA